MQTMIEFNLQLLRHVTIWDSADFSKESNKTKEKKALQAIKPRLPEGYELPEQEDTEDQIKGMTDDEIDIMEQRYGHIYARQIQSAIDKGYINEEEAEERAKDILDSYKE